MVAENNLDLTALNGLSDAEREYALKILADLVKGEGSSKLYDDLKYEEYSEIPVDIETFLTDDRYLGQAWKDASGKLKLYDFWLQQLKKLFPTNIDTAYNTLLESGARGIGKSDIACGGVAAYLLYRVMCLKNPLEHYHLKQTEKICFAFMNIKLALAEDIAISKFQKTIQMSPWFMSRGKMSSYKNKPYWTPPEPIQLIIGSQSDDVIGLPIYYCLDGDTVIITDKGDIPIKDLVGVEIHVPTVDTSGNIVTSESCTVQPTAVVHDYMELTLQDGTILRCSLNHKFMLSDGTYKEAQYLTDEDDILMKAPFGYIYKFTNLETGKLYVGKRECSHFDKNYWGGGKKWLEDLALYGKNKIKREIVCWANSRKELRELEIYYIAKFDARNPEIGYNIHKERAGGNSLGDTTTWSELHKGNKNGRYGMPVSEHTRELISIANTGRHYSAEINKKKGRPGVPKPPGFGDKISAAQKGRIKSSLELQRLRESRSVAAAKTRGKHIYNNGEHEIRLHDGELVPNGYVRGRLPKISELAKTHCMLPRRRWYNNGLKEVLATTCPNGFILGRVRR